MNMMKMAKITIAMTTIMMMMAIMPDVIEHIREYCSNRRDVFLIIVSNKY